jgi:hypothetical protein
VGKLQTNESLMPIYRLLQNSAFDPEHTKAMATAFDDACLELGLPQTDQQQRELIARLVIEFALRGARDPLKLKAHVLAALK